MKSNYLKDEKGAVMVLVALMLTLLIGIGALVFDIGRVSNMKSNMQNAIDATALAAVQDLPNTSTATMTSNTYITLNGYSPSDIIINFPNSNRIKIIGSKNIEYTLAKAIGFDNTNVNVIAVAELSTPLSPFDYAVFSGSTLDLLKFTGNSSTITGNVHSNQDIKGQAIVHGNATVVGEFEDNKLTVDGGTKSDNSSVIQMPNFSSELKKLAIANGTYYTSSQSFNADQINTDLAKGGVIYVEGDFMTNGTGVNASSGSIFATGNITFNGSDVTLSASSPICLYSSSGNITFDGEGADVYGIIYAPNGTVNFNGGGGTIHGRIYGDVVDINGNGFNIVSGTDDYSSIPVKTYKLVE